MILRIPLIFCLFFLSLQFQYQYSSLNMCGSTKCEINLNYASGIYNLTIPIQYAKTHSIVTICYRVRPVVNSTNQQCILTGYDTNYNCYSINMGFFTDNSLLSTSISTFTSSATLLPQNSSTVTNVSPIISNSMISIQISGLTINSIYQAVVGNRNDLINDAGSKLVYFHTFTSGLTDYSGSLFMQRNVQCIVFLYKTYFNYNLIFYGGTLRDSKNTMYFHFLSYLSSDGKTVDKNGFLNMWGGLGLSTSHAKRDMIGFSSGTGQIFDMYSLFSTAPFTDTSENINGTNDFVQISNSYSGNVTYFNAIGGYRLYDTLDTKGDEIIRKKMNYMFCYAAAYSSGSAAILPSSQSFKHPLTKCWTPDITVWQIFKQLQIMAILTFFILMQ